ncbi:D-alanyl-D-alanine carboxypeptidase/D-alanyl-D-alanine-endopeptidase [Streptomyces sp. V3I7]|uniref:D-alanyl-D-alanine carboxypeptidase/D-alanyl-D-alanine endopeptidase n=1 Tax=Streptomyces sp. V3I7 TaxID=3042278 RepID=UPI0027D7E03F|nr:D-alanyl-D-alanine carboxypeptidase/D-alanyl-D-alanine-endopeptidase [Streptomyces sp. V3I7]
MARFADAVRPRLAQAAATAKPQVARLAGALGPELARRLAARPAKTWPYTAGAAAAGLALAVVVVSSVGPWDASGQRTAERDWAAALERVGGVDHGGDPGTSPEDPQTAPSAASVLAGLGGTAGPVKSAPGAKGLTAALEPLLNAPALGGTHTAAVVDVATGRRLYDADGDKALTPASTTKIATAVAALSAMGADHRLITRTALEAGTKELVLVGGGDPTLTAHEKDGGTSLLERSRELGGGWASLRTLADGTAKALKRRGIRAVTLSYDTTRYAGPALHPIGVNDNLAPVSALTADEGRTDQSSSGPVTRVADPAVDAARKFAGFLKDEGIKASSPGPSKATRRAATLSAVSSPPLSALVERMLTNSDNDIAEALARQTAIATGRPASFDGGARAIAAQLTKLHLPVAGARFHDGSGLNRDDRLTANLLTALLAKAGDPQHPALRTVLTGLPVAGFTGTLATRYADGASGLVRAKTGTLTGVNTLAGTVVDKDGHLLAFAFLASGTTNPPAAQAALDRTATALAGCGCG